MTKQTKTVDWNHIVEEVSTGALIECLFPTDQPNWHRRCEIMTDYYMSSWPKIEGGRLTTVIRAESEYNTVFLRHSRGAAQGYFWDVYGDDFLSVERALLALHQAPVPWIFLKSVK